MGITGRGTVSKFAANSGLRRGNGRRPSRSQLCRVITAGKPFQGATYLNDDLSIRDYYGTVNFPNPVALNIGIGLPVAVDSFNTASFTRLNHAVTATVTTYAGLQNTQ